MFEKKPSAPSLALMLSKGLCLGVLNKLVGFWVFWQRRREFICGDRRDKWRADASGCCCQNTNEIKAFKRPLVDNVLKWGDGHCAFRSRKGFEIDSRWGVHGTARTFSLSDCFGYLATKYCWEVELSSAHFEFMTIKSGWLGWPIYRPNSEKWLIFSGHGLYFFRFI